MTDEKTTIHPPATTSTDQQRTSQSSTSTTATFTSSSSWEVLTVSNGGGACATSAYQPGSGDTTNKGLSFGSLTVGLWELAVKSAIKIASARNKSNAPSDSSKDGGGGVGVGGGGGGGGGGGREAFFSSSNLTSTTTNTNTNINTTNTYNTTTIIPVPVSQQRALPPLPSVPPVGPGGRRRNRPLTLTRSQSACSKYPPPSRPSPTQRALKRSQSMAELLSAMVAAKLKPSPTVTRSTHCQECNQRFSLIFRRHHCKICQRSVCAYCSTYQRVVSDLEEEENETESSPAPVVLPCSSDLPPKPGEQVEEDGGGGEGGGGERGKSGGEDSRSKSSSEASKDPEPSLPNVLHRVCRKCASDLEGKQAPLCRSWTEEFGSLRQFFKQGRHVGSPLDNHHLLPPRIPNLPPVCESIARSYLEECKKNVKNKSLFLATSASFNAGLQYALKPPDQKLCTTCSKLLRFPVERKTCALCDKIFCRNCSSRDLALAVPDHLDPGDTSHEMAQINVRVLSKEEGEELDKHSGGSSSSTGGGGSSSSSSSSSSSAPLHRYRTCHPCRDHVAHVLRVMNFNDMLTQIQAEMVDLQEQISAVLDEQDLPSPGIGMTRWPSVRSVHTYTSVEDEIVGEAVSQRVAQKLLERFFQLYLELERLQPETTTQGVLHKHVKQAMSAFYVTRRSVSSKRFNRRESLSSLPSYSAIGWT
ncbi:uncharacterized protein LOC143288711 [Babylonia areolata]|uniref:uncharacterized protein LOC143288711 n=1 Tax=Babylonia areolata TaxID=304850 RepID=UPI003FD64F0A